MRFEGRFLSGVFALAALLFIALKANAANLAKEKNLYSHLAGGIEFPMEKEGSCQNNGSPWDEMQCVEIPEVVFTYKGVEYSLPKQDIQVMVESENLSWKIDAQYDRDKAFKAGMLRIALNHRLADKFSYYLLRDTNTEKETRNNVKHEVVHFLVDAKYFGDARSPEYHFISEMMAYMGGDNMTEIQAARRISERYPDLKALADEFLSSKMKEDRRNTAISIDTSKLEALIKERIALLKNILSKNQVDAEADITSLNENAAKARDVLIEIVSQINAAYPSMEEREKAGNAILERLKSSCEGIERLQKEVEARGIAHIGALPLSADQQSILTEYEKWEKK
mgnify:CR=1 FL=1